MREKVSEREEGQIIRKGELADGGSHEISYVKYLWFHHRRSPEHERENGVKGVERRGLRKREDGHKCD